MPPLRARPIVTLTTDFGLADHYVGTMKGVILNRCPDAELVDISHQIRAFSIHAGAYTIDQAAPYFPPGTIHVVVIDPGVGTTRRALLLEALGQHFIAPDNGVLSMIAKRDPRAKPFELANRAFWLPAPSSTFHGRDVFAPVAAALASGAATPGDVGPLLDAMVLISDLAPKQSQTDIWDGMALSVDHFGNVITNFRATEFAIDTRLFALSAGNIEIRDFKKTFGDAPSELCFAYFGSSGFIEIGMNQSNAAARLNIAPGDRVYLHLRA